MYSERTRTILYFTVCIPIRLTFAYLPVLLGETYHAYLAALTGAMSLGTLNLALRNEPSAQTGFFGGHAWWAPYRAVHALILLLATILLLRRDKKASVFMFIDVLLGLVIYTYIQAKK